MYTNRYSNKRQSKSRKEEEKKKTKTKIIKKVSHAIPCGRQNSMDPTSTFHYQTLRSSVAGSGSLLMTEVSCVTDLCCALPPFPTPSSPSSFLSPSLISSVHTLPSSYD